jgi:hypothetical protein
MPSSQPPTRRAVTSVRQYEDAEHAVDWLSDHDFPVEHVSIIGTDLRFVEQVSGRLTTGRASLLGAGYGALLGVFWGVLFGALFTTSDATYWGVLALTDGRRDFASTAQTRADHYEVQVEDGYAGEAQRLLSTMPAT